MPSSNKSNTVGRPSFPIDAGRLRGLRKEKQLTQAQVIELAHRRLGRPPTSSAVKHYQRIEKNGKTSQAMAAALAAVLGTNVAVLQGELPEDEGIQFIDRLEQHLADQIARKANPALAEHLARYGEASPGELAVEFAGQVESAMFDMRAHELDELARLTGWTAEQLMQPVVVQGHWLISSSPSVSVAEVVLGAGEVTWYISQAAEKYANFHESDTSISLREALPKLHVVVQHPRVPARRRTFSFMRCLPSATGLQWVNPSWRDRLQLDDGLRQWAYTTANFVTDFDGQVRPSDVRRLRLKVEEFDMDRGVWTQVALIKGDLDELHDQTLRSFQIDGSSHDLALNWIIATGFLEVKELLNDWPLECWELRASGASIQISLDVPPRLANSRGQQPQWGLKYAIRLVEQRADGLIQPVPWRESSVKALGEDMKRRLGMPAG